GLEQLPDFFDEFPAITRPIQMRQQAFSDFIFDFHSDVQLRSGELAMLCLPANERSCGWTRTDAANDSRGVGVELHNARSIEFKKERGETLRIFTRAGRIISLSA